MTEDWTVADWALGAGIAVAALAVSVWLGGLVAKSVLAAAQRSDDTPDATAGDSIDSAARVQRGGAWIGTLERFAITASIIVGYPAAIAVVVAVKGLGRYPEIKDNPGVSERFVIGTLASMLWAAVVGLAAGQGLRIL